MWEYYTVYVKRKGRFGNIFEPKIDPEYEKWMSEMGQAGWELVSVSPQVMAGSHQGDTMYFKRRIPGLPDIPDSLSEQLRRTPALPTSSDN